jgi:hypothetical protein
MPYIVTTAWYPSDRVTEVVKTYFEVLKKYPPDDSLGEAVVPAAVTTTKRGIKTLGITEVKEGKLEEALNRARSVMVMYHNIKGYEYSVAVYATVSEALAFVDMELPE